MPGNEPQKPKLVTQPQFTREQVFSFLRQQVIYHVDRVTEEQLVNAAIALGIIKETNGAEIHHGFVVNSDTQPPVTVRSGASQAIADQIREENQWDVA